MAAYRTKILTGYPVLLVDVQWHRIAVPGERICRVDVDKELWLIKGGASLPPGLVLQEERSLDRGSTLIDEEVTVLCLERRPDGFVDLLVVEPRVGLQEAVDALTGPAPQEVITDPPTAKAYRVRPLPEPMPAMEQLLGRALGQSLIKRAADGTLFNGEVVTAEVSLDESSIDLPEVPPLNVDPCAG